MSQAHLLPAKSIKEILIMHTQNIQPGENKDSVVADLRTFKITCCIQTKKVRCKACLSKHSLSQFLFILRPNLHLQYSVRSRRVRVDATCTTAAHRVAVLQHLQHDHRNKSAHCPQNHVHNGNTIQKDYPGKKNFVK